LGSGASPSLLFNNLSASNGTVVRAFMGPLALQEAGTGRCGSQIPGGHPSAVVGGWLVFSATSCGGCCFSDLRPLQLVVACTL
jgi:hypothetical protein